MNLGNAFVFGTITFFVAACISSRKNHTLLSREASKLFVLTISITCSLLFWAVALSFGCFGRSTCSDIQRDGGFWFTLLAFFAMSIFNAMKLYKVSNGSLKAIMQEVILPLFKIIIPAIIVGIIAGITT